VKNIGRLKDKVTIISGGASGIGRASAYLFAQEGAQVVIADIAQEAGEETAYEIQKAGGKAMFIAVDVVKADQVSLLIDRVVTEFDHIDVLMNNAATWRGDTTILDVTEEVWNAVIDGVLKSAFLMTKCALPHMINNGQGSIVNISSINAIYGVGLTAYTAAKGGMISMTKLIAAEYGDRKIRANAILPGTIVTDSSMAVWQANPGSLDVVTAAYPLGRIGTPDDVAYCALYLASDESAFVTGSIYLVDGGLTAGKNFGF
jgi:NAD(P)-dependent dehydrogenase (short-subunit alcohol dehydrogenase family)